MSKLSMCRFRSDWPMQSHTNSKPGLPQPLLANWEKVDRRLWLPILALHMLGAYAILRTVFIPNLEESMHPGVVAIAFVSFLAGVALLAIGNTPGSRSLGLAALSLSMIQTGNLLTPASSAFLDLTYPSLSNDSADLHELLYEQYLGLFKSLYVGAALLYVAAFLQLRPRKKQAD